MMTQRYGTKQYLSLWVTFQSSMNQVWHVTTVTDTGPDLWSFELKTLTSTPTIIVQMWLGLHCWLKCGMLKNTAKCIRFVPDWTAVQSATQHYWRPNWSKPSLQMSLRCQLKSFSWNWDERQSYDRSLTATKLLWRPERERESVKERESEGVKQINRQTKRVTGRK